VVATSVIPLIKVAGHTAWVSLLYLNLAPGAGGAGAAGGSGSGIRLALLAGFSSLTFMKSDGPLVRQSTWGVKGGRGSGFSLKVSPAKSILMICFIAV